MIEKWWPENSAIPEAVLDREKIILQRIDEARGRIRFNLGCGVAHAPGFINIDVAESCQPDVVWDVQKSIPFPDRCATEIQSRDFLEHVHPEALAQVMRECHRVLKIGGICVHEVPGAPNAIAFQDPTHRTFFTSQTPFYWMQGHSSRRWEKYGQSYGYVPFRLVRAEALKEKKTGKPTGWIRMKFYK